MRDTSGEKSGTQSLMEGNLQFASGFARWEGESMYRRKGKEGDKKLE